MKKMMYAMLAIGLLWSATSAWTQNSPTPAATELRPSQVLMQARAGWVKAMNANLAAMKYEEIGKDAAALAAQTGSVAEKLSNPLAKELTLKVSSLATATADAAGKKDGETVKMKLAEIKATCGECHAKIRDKK
jgi:predicted secreted protein